MAESVNLPLLKSRQDVIDRIVSLCAQPGSFILLTGAPGSGRSTVCEAVLQHCADKVKAIYLPLQSGLSLADLRLAFAQQLHGAAAAALPLDQAAASVPAGGRILLAVDGLEFAKPELWVELNAAAAVLKRNLTGSVLCAALPEYVSALALPADAQILTLSGMPQDECLQLMQALAGAGAADLPAAQLMQSSQGLPGRLIALTRDYLRSRKSTPFSAAPAAPVPEAAADIPPQPEVKAAPGRTDSAAPGNVPFKADPLTPPRREAKPVKPGSKQKLPLRLVSVGIAALIIIAALLLWQSCSESSDKSTEVKPEPAPVPAAAPEQPQPETKIIEDNGALSGAVQGGLEVGKPDLKGKNQVVISGDALHSIESGAKVPEHTQQELQDIKKNSGGSEPLMVPPVAEQAVPPAVRTVPESEIKQSVKQPESRAESKPEHKASAKRHPVSQPQSQRAASHRDGIRVLTPAQAAKFRNQGLSHKLNESSELAAKPDNHYTLQLIAGPNLQKVKAYAGNAQGQYFIYERLYQGASWYVLVCGDYASKAQAAAALRQLPAGTRPGAFIKSFGTVKQEIK